MKCFNRSHQLGDKMDLKFVSKHASWWSKPDKYCVKLVIIHNKSFTLFAVEPKGEITKGTLSPKPHI